MASVAAASGAGVPALAVLLISTLLGLGAGFCAGRRTRSCGGRPSQANVASHASCIGLVAVVFCLWALRNCVFSSPHFDLGALTFALAFGAAVYAVLRVSRSDDPGPARRAMQGVPLACALVALNYLIGVVFVSGPPMLRLYMCAGLAWWTIAGVSGFIVSKRLLDDLWSSGSVRLTGRSLL
eukprot:TRINITY_DN26863_c0_g1_i1.p1 TRINITY_DN26863_c0_g1~~TRINITY_DN26863_c0_g1_i1.p1  ORF type:complete len:182 (+),score=32.31 TRINITY_DN26863_c0_g1_i1:54-599(+)